MGTYNYDFHKAQMAIARTCYVLHEEGKEVTPDEFSEKFQDHDLYEKIPLERLITYVYHYFRRRKLY